MKNIHAYLNKLRLNSGAIWLESERIKVFVPKSLQNHETKEFIINNKSQIRSILSENNIYSKEKFLNIIIFKDNITTDYPLSPAQERLWFIEQYERGSNAYHIPAVFELEENSNISGLKYALQQIVLRHEVLRSTIEWGKNQEGIQVVHEEPLAIEDVRVHGKDDFEALIREDINRPFELNSEYPIRVKFYRIESENSKSDHPAGKIIVLINTHHIASDGWSAQIFQREVFAFYDAYLNNDNTFKLPALEIQYKDYAIWQRSYLTGEVLKNQLTYWKDKLSGYQTLALPTDYIRKNQIDYKGSSEAFKLSHKVSEKLRAIAQQYGVTLHSVMLSSINILLSKYTGQEDIVTGTPIANRHYRQTEGLIGFFVNTLVNRTLLSKSQSYEELIQQIHQEQISAQLHQDLPFEKLVDELRVERDTSRHPIFQVMFVVQSFGISDTANEKKRKYSKPYNGSTAYEVEKFDLSIYINDSGEEFIGQINYATSLFCKNTIINLISRYTHLLAQLTDAPNRKYSELSLILPDEYDQIICEWNNTDKVYPRDKTIYALFQEQVEKTPDRVALVYEEGQLTYRELNERSNQLARHIRAQYRQRANEELKPDTLVAMCLDRSLEMLIGILAVLKAGGAYVPLDPGYPQERIDYILEDTKAILVLSKRNLVESTATALPAEKVVYIDLTEDIYQTEDCSNLPLHSGAKDLVYVIYTSGTTGKPKGVMLEHFSVCNRILHIISYSSITSSDFHLFKTNYVFDASFFEIFTHLCVGATLEITKYLFEVSELNRLLISKNFTSLHLVPSQYELVSSTINSVNLDKIYFSGEALTSKILSGIDKTIRIYNYYGPTELGEITVSSPLTAGDAPVIGKLFPNCRQYVLDQNKVPVPIGVTGELYIGGDGMARGYLNKKDLTAERFIANPFATAGDKAKGYTRLYKTGDLVRWLADGNLEYIGRNDDQVKIRGYRVELGEIEHVLSQIAGIKQSAVLAKERKTPSGSSKYLVGYYVLEGDADGLMQETILEKLSMVLPDYMVPDVLLSMESFPLTVNGKLDKRALPEAEFSSSVEYVAPVTGTEIAISKIWQEVLGLEKAGITDNFFRIGGNSILAIKVVSRIRKELAIELTVKELFVNTTIETISKIIERKKYTIEPSLNEPLNSQTTMLPNREGIYDSLYSQAWRYFEYKSGIYSPMNSLIKRELSNVNQKAMSMAVDSLVARHESLRTLFFDREGKVFQKIYPIDKFTSILSLEDVCEHENKEEIVKTIFYEMLAHLFDFKNEQSFICKLIRYEKDKYVFIFVIDHIINDSQSPKIIEEELFILYDAYDKGFPNPLQPLKFQFRDYVSDHNQHYRGQKLVFHQLYFKKLFKDIPPKLTVRSTDFFTKKQFTNYLSDELDNPTTTKNSKGRGYVFMISKEILDQIKTLTSKEKKSFFNFILAAYCVFLNNITNHNDFSINSPMSTRNNDDYSKIIGWLTGELFLRVKIDKNCSFRDLLDSCRDVIVEALDHIYYQDIVNLLSVEWDQLVSAQLNLVNDTNSAEVGIVNFAPYHYIAGHVSSGINFNMSVHENGIIVNCTYKTNVIYKAEISKICEHFTRVLKFATTLPDIPIQQWKTFFQNHHSMSNA